LSQAAYIIGIDLGTTTSVVAYTQVADIESQRPHIEVFNIPQRVDAGAIEALEMLPSFVMVPGAAEIEGLKMPWERETHTVVGELARERGAEVPARLISSSKSWLCHSLVDRNQPILPWEAPADVKRFSPVEASSLILDHIRQAWNREMARKLDGATDEALRMENQEIFLTVPASFDAVARELTVRAAELAGLSRVTLIEEPQAVFYAWIEASEDRWREMTQPGDIILVCDVGGGTTDFSLIRVVEEAGSLALERIAVGNHLLVGGDNMDLALAHSVAHRLAAEGTRLDSWQMRAVWHSCRKVKETLLSDEQLDRCHLTVLGRGSSLIGSTFKTFVSQAEARRVILDGFFPTCGRDARPSTPPSAGIRELGLTYEADPAITHHLAHFIDRQLGGEQGLERFPTGILFNGGVMKPKKLRGRILEQLRSWGAGFGRVREIQSENLDLAVARGAVYYGLARRGKGIRIRSGLNKSYYIGVAASLPAVPGIPAPMKALCVAPFGMEEGTEADIRSREFVLSVGEPVRFDFLGSSLRQEDPLGEIIEDWEGDLEEVTTIETTLDAESGSHIPVTIQVKVTEMGTLELWCVSAADGRRWKLEFDVRESHGARHS
jgi:hypothetical protein